MVQEGRGYAAIDVWATAKPLCGRYLSFAEREEIALLRVQGYPCRRSLAGSGERHRQSQRAGGATPPLRKRRPRASCDDSAMARRALLAAQSRAVARNARR